MLGSKIGLVVTYAERHRKSLSCAWCVIQEALRDLRALLKGRCEDMSKRTSGAEEPDIHRTGRTPQGSLILQDDGPKIGLESPGTDEKAVYWKGFDSKGLQFIWVLWLAGI